MYEGYVVAVGRRRQYSYHARDPVAWEPAVMIHTGLSVTVAGHLVDLVRDEERRVATVRAVAIPGHAVTGLEVADVAAAASLLAARARRFLGPHWRVVPWSPPGGASMPAAGA